MLRTSSYLIYVDLPDDPDHLLLVHGYSGAYDLVSHRVGSYLRARETHRPPKPLYGQWLDDVSVDLDATLSARSVETLARRGYLTELTPEAETARFTAAAAILHEAAQLRHSYVFMPTYDCNLRCFYCFQDHMRTDERYRRLLRTMTPELVDRVFSGIERLERDKGVVVDDAHPRDLGLFGGEPLLAANRGAVEAIMRRAQQSGPGSFWAISNGCELDAYADLLGPGLIDSIQITLDGPPAEHDLRRVHADGSGSFDLIARNIDLALARGTSIQVRMNVDRANVAQLPELVATFDTYGWSADPGFVAYVYPIHAANDQTERSSTFTTWELDVAVDALRLEHPEIAMVGRPDERIRRAAHRVFGAGADPGLKAEYCGAHSGMYIFDALGDVYACWERTGDDKVRIGSVTQEGTLRMNLPVLTDWRSRSVGTVKACQHCRFALYCGGGCAVLAEGKRGTLHANYCDGFANRFRAMVAEAYGQHRRGVEIEDERVTIAAI